MNYLSENKLLISLIVCVFQGCQHNFEINIVRNIVGCINVECFYIFCSFFNNTSLFLEVHAHFQEISYIYIKNPLAKCESEDFLGHFFLISKNFLKTNRITITFFKVGIHSNMNTKILSASGRRHITKPASNSSHHKVSNLWLHEAQNKNCKESRCKCDSNQFPSCFVKGQEKFFVCIIIFARRNREGLFEEKNRSSNNIGKLCLNIDSDRSQR